MVLHVFNPWHDEALANGSPYFCPSKAASRLEKAWAVLPAWWAAAGEAVLVPELPDDAWLKKVEPYLKEVEFVTPNRLPEVSELRPWGWDALLMKQMERLGLSASLFPDAEQFKSIVSLSGRSTSAKLLTGLQELNSPLLTGEAFVCTDLSEVERRCATFPVCLLKAPWSGSGRGLRRIDGRLGADDKGWAKNVLNKQKYVMVEPYYTKVQDFAMEFFSDGKGQVCYEGFSIFSTDKQTYNGGFVVSEPQALSLLTPYVPASLLHDVERRLSLALSSLVGLTYKGPLGVDMMIVKGEGNSYFLHPCVELNLRTTMGYFALKLRRLLPANGSARLIYAHQAEALPLTPYCDAETPRVYFSF